jgi:hypothetical protein
VLTDQGLGDVAHRCFAAAGQHSVQPLDKREAGSV